MAEWSRAPANSPREQGGVGSNPTPAEKILFALFLSLFDHSVTLICVHKTKLEKKNAFRTVESVTKV